MLYLHITQDHEAHIISKLVAYFSSCKLPIICKTFRAHVLTPSRTGSLNAGSPLLFLLCLSVGCYAGVDYDIAEGCAAGAG